MKRLLVAGAISLIGIAAAHAAPVTFFGEDVNTAGDPTTVPFTNATNARNGFFSNLVGVGTQTFESYPTGTGTPLTISFGAAGSATLNGGTVASGSDGAGRYPFSGTQYLNVGTGSFSLSFSAPIAAFGFYGTDIGDFGGTITLTLVDATGHTSTITVPNTVGTAGSTSGSNLYFGFYDTGDTYKSISFGNNSGGADVFAFDDFSIGSTEQVAPGVPEPSTWTMMILGFFGLGFMAYRRKAAPSALGLV